MKYDPKKSLIENALAKAEYYEKLGNKKKAQEFLTMAEKAEKLLKQNKQTILNIEKTRGLR